MQGHEVTWHGIRHVDLDAAQEDQVPWAEVRVRDGEHLLLHLLVRLHDKVDHWLLRFGDLAGGALELAAQPTLLQVLRVRSHVCSRGDLAVGGDDGPTRRGEGGLTGPQELAGLAIRGEADVRPEDDEHVAVVWHVVGEGHEAGLPDVGRAADAAQREGPPVVLGQECGQVSGVAVDLVRADRLAVDGVALLEAERLHRRHELGHHSGALRGAREGCDDGVLDVLVVAAQEGRWRQRLGRVLNNVCPGSSLGQGVHAQSGRGRRQQRRGCAQRARGLPALQLGHGFSERARGPKVPQTPGT
mmetsp:Transcript_46978/g.94870  ORF Transcript_46978/g.94870 Transcript_46978/m.94870 type:complete len:301 (-) Transcript_46978:34-936(-)